MSEEPTRLEQLVEEMGVMFEENGLSPITGRAFAFLLLSDPAHQSFYAIREFLKASKSSVSNALNFLMDHHYIDYITFSGDRKRYFRVNAELWLEEIKVNMTRFKSFSVLMESILEERKAFSSTELNRGLEEILDFFNFFSEEFPSLIEKWEASRKSDGGRMSDNI